MLTHAQREQFATDGYLVLSQLFTPDETVYYREHFMHMRESGSYPGDDLGVAFHRSATDPLKRYPRMIHMHRWDNTARDWLIDDRINAALTGLLDREPYAVQTMVYFKPAGSRGQALHQDNYYLRVQPGTCIAAWMALDDCTIENGCIQVVPGSHRWPLLCTTQADTTLSFTDVTVPIPAGTETRPVTMQAGDVLFFNGQLVHGSFPNTTADRFRRALIGHYIEGDSQQVAEWYNPVLRMDGTPLEMEKSALGGKCGVWTEGELALIGHDITKDASAV